MSPLRVSLCLFLCCFAVAANPRHAPAHPVVLRSAQLELTLDGDAGLPYEYHLLANNAIIRGEMAGRDITATVFRANPREFSNLNLKPREVKAAKTRADFAFTGAAADFTLR